MPEVNTLDYKKAHRNQKSPYSDVPLIPHGAFRHKGYRV